MFRKTGSLKLIDYCDGDWASSLDNRRSITGYCFFIRRKKDLRKKIQWHYQLVKLNTWQFRKHAKSFHTEYNS